MITSAPRVAEPVKQERKNSGTTFRKPTRSDGKQIHELISNCPPLDENSAYCNFLQSTHFQDTCLIVEQDGKALGFISAYLKPDEEKTLFIWQVAVHPKARGQGLAFRMLQQLLIRDELRNVASIETTITEDNEGSWNLFKKLDKAHGKRGQVTTFLDEIRHFKGEHDTEYLYRIPLNQ
ncbi:diaminobutyrate acetyltransferase [Vibrio viridaestus]|uniref:L-2,4-diaminobutyric acid acetyltransferase n=1 Tax=Vibrio viridaestus TaxID=2487322 RepID=A0A3N9TM09_9VIBR|nr:diaminobutyrate acetyltransferase [Vibrio viridaestus]RQW64873.1 diaminobutyrate acetyltransferase [Vibrio viridaestus]